MQRRMHCCKPLQSGGTSRCTLEVVRMKTALTKYLPVKDGQDKVIAVLFTGLDFTEGLKALKDKIRSIRIGLI